MTLSIRMKKFIRLLLAGTSIAIALCCGCFLCFMGSSFTLRDIKCRDYLETSHFANELQTMIYNLNWDADRLNSNTNSIPNSKIFLNELYLWKGGNPVKWTNVSSNHITFQEFMDIPEYWYTADPYGIREIYTVEDNSVVYNSDWYAAALSESDIREATSFYTLTHDQYVDVIVQYSERNDGNQRGKSLGASGIKNDVEEWGDYARAGMIEEATEAVTPSYTLADFSEDSYIGYADGLMYVYSPREDMFYSSLFGWYSVPDTLYFLASDMDPKEFASPVDILRYQFTSQREIFREMIGEDYLDYIRAQKDLNFTERNMVYYVVADDQLYSNVRDLDQLINCHAYLCIRPTASGEYTIETYNFTNENLTDEYATNLVQTIGSLKPDEAFYVGLYTTYPYDDIFAEGYRYFHNYFPYTVPALILMICMVLFFLVMEIRIFQTCGRGEKSDPEIYLNLLDKLPVEIMILLVIFSGTGLLGTIGASISATIYYFDWYILVEGVTALAFAYVFLHVGLLSLIRRGKAKVFWSRSLTRWTFWIGKQVVRSISGQRNLTVRTVELFLLYWFTMGFLALFSFICMAAGIELLFLIGMAAILFLNIGVLVLMIRQARGEQSIREAIQAFAEGNLEYRIPKKKHLITEQEIIDNMNHLSDGLHKALEKSIYDERMKAELITNVSHDIKTPLTSIINYVDLIKQEKIEDEKMVHYIEVLDRKSQRLKQLMEDLVEVSKISSGNIELERMPIDFGELLRQSIGEFEDKFAEQELKLIENIQDKSYMIYADGRRTFRILENLFQNVYKYAMPNTRVYIDLQNENDKVFLTIKNISKAPLNIDAKELMERFVRGEQSRTTEGSGLGLSIAQELVRLQDGEFQIYLDGDLFKVNIVFPEFISSEVIESEAVTLEAPEQGEVPVIEKA